MTGRLLVAGTSSDAGKTIVVAGLCRSLHRRGVSVAPFKAQNMSLNSFVTRDGKEIGRAQAMQAHACGIEPTATMNPILLKPGSDSQSQVIVMGKPVAEPARAGWFQKSSALLPLVVEAFDSLTQSFDAVICEGAGSVSEINLRENDIVNMGFARATSTPTVLVTDIDRGGSFGALTGSLALLDRADQRLIRGFIFNRFRGDKSLLDPGLSMLLDITGRPTLGVVPYSHGLALDAEDSLEIDAYRDPLPPIGNEILRVSVIAYPRMSNATDLDPIANEPGVLVRFVSRPEELVDTDLVVLPGTRATVADLEWLRRRGFDKALASRDVCGLPILGICGGYQMLGATIADAVESRQGVVAGLGLLPLRTTFGTEKTLARPRVRTAEFGDIEGYEIHHGHVSIDGGQPWFADVGCKVGAVAGSLWHGLFENDRFRRAYLTSVAHLAARSFVVSESVQFEAIREARVDRIADLVDQHIDTHAIDKLLSTTAVDLTALPGVRLVADRRTKRH